MNIFQILYYSNIDTNTKNKHRDTIYDTVSINITANVLLNILNTTLNSNIKSINWLDVGCGVGKIAEIARKHEIDSFEGIDISQANICKCLSLYPKYSFILGDFETFCFNKQYDLITFYSTLHHFEDYNYIINRAINLLKPNGIILIEQEPRVCKINCVNGYNLIYNLMGGDYGRNQGRAFRRVVERVQESGRFARQERDFQGAAKAAA